MKELFKKLLSVSAGLAVAATAAGAQSSGTITGRVLTEAGAPLPSASVSIQSLGVGAYTNDQGVYKFTVPAARMTGQSVTMTARRVGYAPKTVAVTLSGSSIQQDFQLVANANQLTGVVVTALGIEKNKSQLGTSVQQLSSSELNATRDQNVVNQLSGKISGVTISASGTQGGSTRILIRGANSITGNNQPLFIVDGTAVSNDAVGSDAGGSGRGVDFGSVINDINPENIATISVLKGPNAAALYGSRAANGVILITTKRGIASGGKVNSTLTSSFTFDSPSMLPDYQNLYGQGSQGSFAFKNGKGGGDCDGCDQSYGPRLNSGLLIPQFDSPVVNGVITPTPWVSHPDNVKSFFDTGKTFTNNLAFSGGTERANARLSVGSENTSGIIPNNTFNKFTGSLAGALEVSSRLSTTANIQYSNNTAHNRPGVGYNTGILEQFIWFGRQVDVAELKNYAPNPAYPFSASCNGQFNWNCNFHNNPYYIQYANPESDKRNHIIATAQGTWKMTDWLNATLRSGNDQYRWNIGQSFAPGNLNFDDLSGQGAFYTRSDYNNENNTELLLTANKQVASRLQLSGTMGGSRRMVSYDRGTVSSNNLLSPGIFNSSNSAVAPTVTQYNERQQTNGVYGSGSFTWDNWWTVEVTGRNDWSSTLPKGNNSYFYPSINTSLVLTDMIPSLKSSVISYAKLRGSVAQVGASASPYQIATTYNGNSLKFGSLPQTTLADQVANRNLMPEQTKSGEVGLELGLFNNRVTFDGAYYSKATTNEIVNLTVSPASGFTSAAINAGKLKNAGFDAQLTVTPIKATGFEWNSTFNYAQNRSRLVALVPGLKTIVLGSTWYTNTEARVGEPYGAIYGDSYLRDSATKQLIVSDGLPQRGPRKVLGNITPRWTGGWNNEVKWKGITANALFDFHVGGQVFSVSNYFGENAGTFASSLRGREVAWDKPGIVVKGIDKATGQPNTVNVDAETYYQSLFHIAEPYVFNDSWVKLREVRVGFDLPQAFASSIKTSNVNLAFVGRNLWTHSQIPNNIDPEFSYQTGNNQGAEFAALPNPKSVGLNIRITP